MDKTLDKLRAPLTDGLVELGIDAQPLLIDALLLYVAELNRWNKAYNLTAVRDPIDMVPRHILDAYSITPYISGHRIIDVGTGAGLPGIPLALGNPDQQFTLLDSNGKKIRFVQHIIGELGLHNVTAVQSRVDEFHDDLFETVVCRAFTALPDFVTGSGHLAAPEGRLVAMKGKLADAELSGLPAGWAVAAADRLRVPGLEGERHAVVLRRT